MLRNKQQRKWSYNSAYSNSSRQGRTICKRQLSQIAIAAEAVNVETFRQLYFGKRPVILKGQFRDLPAIKKWHDSGFSYLRKYGSSIVPVEVSRGSASYATQSVAEHFERIELPLSLFLDFLSHFEQEGEAGQAQAMKVYLAQHALFDSVPELYKDVCSPSFVESKDGKRLVPDYTMVGRGDIYNINAWIGVSTHTPLHHDPYHNIFTQLCSRKRVMMFPPELKGSLRMKTDPLLKNTSSIPDVFDANLPVDLNEHAFEGTIESGDGLYIPEGWVHSFKGDPGISCSVNWWFK